MTCTNKRRGFPWRKFLVTLRPIRMRPAAKVGDKNKNNRDCRDFQAFAKWFSMFNNLYCENRALYLIHGNKDKDIPFKIFKVTRFWQVDNFPENREDLKIFGVAGLKIPVVVSALLDQRGKQSQFQRCQVSAQSWQSIYVFAWGFVAQMSHFLPGLFF